MNNIKKLRTIALLTVLIIICAAIVFGLDWGAGPADLSGICTNLSLVGDACDNFDISGSYVDPEEDDWYTIQDWEKQVCRQAIPADIPSVTSGNIPYLSDLTFTVVGEMTNLTNPATNETRFLYEVNYYLYAWEEAYSFAVWLTHSDTTRYPKRQHNYQIKAADVVAADGSKFDYVVSDYTTDEFDQVQLDLVSSSSIGTSLVVPLINKETSQYSGNVITGTSASGPDLSYPQG
jgi:hypothetical protein